MWIHASRRYPLIAAVTLAVLVTGGAAGSAATQAADPAPLTLRLTDLPKGWAVGDDTGCGPMGIEGATPEVTALVRELHPQVCVREFNKLWGTAKPFYVQSLAMTFEGDGADRALAATPGLLAYFGLQGASPSATTVAIGDRSRVFVQPKGYPPGPQPSPETAVAWRSGQIYSFVVASARTQAAATTAAVGYARAQQARIAVPTPVSDADFEDLEVGLDKPGLEVPVWWLGRTWDPPGALPPVTLHQAALASRHLLPGQSVDLTYGSDRTVRASGGAWIFLWTPASWKRWTKLRVGQTGWKSPCARSTTFHVAAGRAVIWSGYWNTPKTRPCPQRAPDITFAHVYGKNVVVTVNIPIGTVSEPPRRTAYDSVQTLKSVVRALRLRR